jgi:hypothetical protein
MLARSAGRRIAIRCRALGNTPQLALRFTLVKLPRKKPVKKRPGHRQNTHGKQACIPVIFLRQQATTCKTGISKLVPISASYLTAQKTTRIGAIRRHKFPPRAQPRCCALSGTDFAAFVAPTALATLNYKSPQVPSTTVTIPRQSRGLSRRGPLKGALSLLQKQPPFISTYLVIRM